MAADPTEHDAPEEEREPKRELPPMNPDRERQIAEQDLSQDGGGQRSEVGRPYDHSATADQIEDDGD